MLSPIEKARKETPERKRIIALVGAGLIVIVIFSIWISAFISRVSNERISEADVEEYKPTLLESIKRKTTLLLGDLEIPQIGSPVEYKQLEKEPVEPTLEEKTGIGTTTEEESFDDLIDELLEEKTETILEE